MDRPEHHNFFEGQSDDYSKFRPKTPQQCVEWILEYLSGQITSENGKYSTAADIGCGTGRFDFY